MASCAMIGEVRSVCVNISAWCEVRSLRHEPSPVMRGKSCMPGEGWSMCEGVASWHGCV